MFPNTASTDTAMDTTANPPLRKSQRKRQTNKKFTDDEYALDEDFPPFTPALGTATDSTKLKSTSSSSLVKQQPLLKQEPTEDVTLKVVKLEAEKKGELKLRIKRIVTTPSAVNSFSATTANYLATSPALAKLEENSSDCADAALPQFTSQAPSSEERRTRRKRNLSDFSLSNNSQNNPESVESSATESKSLKIATNTTPTATSNSNLKSQAQTELAITISPLAAVVASVNSSPNASSVSPSQNTPMTRAALAKLKQQTTPNSNANAGNAASALVDVKLLPPPVPVPLATVLPQNLFNDEENEDYDETSNTTLKTVLAPPPPPPPVVHLPSRLPQQNLAPRGATGVVKTLAQIKSQMAALKETRNKRKSQDMMLTEIKSETHEASTAYSHDIKRAKLEEDSLPKEGGPSDVKVNEEDEEVKKELCLTVSASGDLGKSEMFTHICCPMHLHWRMPNSNALH